MTVHTVHGRKIHVRCSQDQVYVFPQDEAFRSRLSVASSDEIARLVNDPLASFNLAAATIQLHEIILDPDRFVRH